MPQVVAHRRQFVTALKPVGRVRVAHLFSGRAPKTGLFPYDWYNSPNLHYLTVDDFEETAAKEGWLIERRFCLAGTRKMDIMPNLTAEVAVYLIRK